MCDRADSLVELDTTQPQPSDVRGRAVTRHVDQLSPHPVYIKHELAVHARDLSVVAVLGDRVFLEPLFITHEGIILDGLVRWMLAEKQGRTMLHCIEYDMSEGEALQCLIQRHRRSSEWNDFIRISLALELEPFLKEKARANQRVGGRDKGSSNLTEAGSLDVRKELALIAGVSVGNVTKVKQLMITAHPDVIRALREKELSIHRGWLLSKRSHEEQRKMLFQHQSERGIRKAVRQLVAGHVPGNASAFNNNLDNVPKLIAALRSRELPPITVTAVNIPGNAIFLTKELLRSLQIPERLPLECATRTP